MPCVSRLWKGSSLATTTDSDGIFVLTPVPPGRQVLLIVATGTDGTERALRRPIQVAVNAAIELNDVNVSAAGELAGRILLVVFIEREEDLVRIISARRATRHERRRYEEGEKGK